LTASIAGSRLHSQTSDTGITFHAGCSFNWCFIRYFNRLFPWFQSLPVLIS